MALSEMVALGQRAGEHGDGEEHAGIEEHGEPVEARPFDGIAQVQESEEVPAEHHVGVEKGGEAGCHQTTGPGEEEAAFQHGEDVEEGEDGARAAARRDDAGDEGDVEADLHPGEATELSASRGAKQEETGHDCGRGDRDHEGRELRGEGVGEAQDDTRHQHEGGGEEPRPAELAQGRPQELPVFHCRRYLTRVTSLKIGRYMATTRPPMITPSTTIMMGSRRAVSAPTAVSTSSS